MDCFSCNADDLLRPNKEGFVMDRLLEILYEIRPEVDFINSSDLIEKRLLDSLDIVVLVSDIEEVFGITIDVNDIVPENFDNLAAIINLIERRGGQI